MIRDKFKFMTLHKVLITIDYGNLHFGKGYGNILRKSEAAVPKSLNCHFRALFLIQRPRKQEKLRKIKINLCLEKISW